MKSLSIAFVLVVLSACSAKMLTFTKEDVSRGEAKFPGTTAALLTAGKSNYESNCQSCHSLVPPTAKSENEWRRIVPGMVRKTNKKAGKIAVDSTMEASILRYVVTMGSAPQPTK